MSDLQTVCKMQQSFTTDLISGNLEGGRAGSAPPPLGDGLTPSLTVMLVNAKV